MGDIRGFLEVPRQEHGKRPAEERVRDWREFDLLPPEVGLRQQASRCMDCGVPFCHVGCPFGNVIPEFNDHAFRGRHDRALAILHATNNFPEFTGRVCPAPCEASCTLNLEDRPVTIKDIERSIIDRAWEADLVAPQVPRNKSGWKVAVIGSGPAGLAAAQELARRGHEVVVFEKDDRIGGLLRYGIPDFKLEKHLIDRRVAQMGAEGVVFEAGVHAGEDIHGEELKARFDAILLCGGARVPRDLPVPGRNLKGVHFALPFLRQANARVAGDAIPDPEAILASGKRVVVVGGGDTGSDCVGTALRQGASSVLQIELLPQPPVQREPSNPWPAWPRILRTSSSQEEGGRREWSLLTRCFKDDGHGRVRGVETVRLAWNAEGHAPIPGSEETLPADLVLLALGFVGSERNGLMEQLGVEMDNRGNVRTDRFATSVEGVFCAGDQQRGQSLVAWAISDGRRAAAACHAYLKTKGE